MDHRDQSAIARCGTGSRWKAPGACGESDKRLGLRPKSRTSALGQKQIPRHVRGVRFTPDSGHSSVQVDVRCVPKADLLVNSDLASIGAAPLRLFAEWREPGRLALLLYLRSGEDPNETLYTRFDVFFFRPW